MRSNDERYDLAVVGAGVVGLAHALAGARRGLRVIVLDREARAVGASIRNFGFITVTGQSAATWQRARRTREIWDEIAPLAGIPIIHRNECLIVHSAQALDVLHEFVATEMGIGCELLDADQLAQRVPMARLESVTGALWSPHDLRIEPRTATPALAAFLESGLGVTIRRGVHVRAVETPEVITNRGVVHADRVIVAPGPDLVTLFPELHARAGTRLCKLHMLRLAPQPADWRLPAAIMSDLGLIRYQGFSAQPSAAALQTLLATSEAELLAHGIHLIVVQSADGSLIVGDSHEYGSSHDPFFSSEIEALMLQLAHAVLQIPEGRVVERWIGIYPQSESCEWFVDAPDALTRVVQVTTGNGMSTSFGLAEEVIDELVAAPPSLLEG
jgi:D-hydroxyproline dehydrogenase subunit beta